MNERELFLFLGNELGVNPARVLLPVDLPPLKIDIGPYYKVQYVIEFVGSELISEATAKSFLEPKTKAGYGNPELYVMVPGQKRWRALWAGDNSMAYDSLAFTWDILTPRGNLTSKSAQELWNRADKAAKVMMRRAIPLPPPSEIDEAAHNLKEIRESLDIGIDLVITDSKTGIGFRPLMEFVYEMGFRYESGVLVWKQPGWNEPLLTILSFSDDGVFSFHDEQVEGVGIGFSVPTNPNPPQSLERLFVTADRISERFQARIFDNEVGVFTEKQKEKWRDLLNRALASFEQVGISPGSPEALRLFSD